MCVKIDMFVNYQMSGVLSNILVAAVSRSNTHMVLTMLRQNCIYFLYAYECVLNVSISHILIIRSQLLIHVRHCALIGMPRLPIISVVNSYYAS